MKVLGICAGRHGGNSETLLKEALLACQESGAEVKMINLFDYNIEHCIGCEMCTMQMGEMEMGKRDHYDGCVLKNKDDMDKIVNEMQTCNGVIVGVTLFYAVISVTAVILGDVLMSMMDPRISFTTKAR